ncbi:MAG TPA: hypothetical protein VHS31_18550 [Tepidisphaeraceae bacterium]|nr:hypothetical protein [Tepidisphaeraceae bacterium]
MSIASPFWLLFLIPWAALVIWFLAGRRHRVGVPFLELWGGPVSAQKIRRTIQPPPIALACVLIALLLSIVGAASPIVRSHRQGSPITLIVDRGVSMSAPSTLHQLAQSVSAVSFSRVVMIPSWPGLLSDGANWQDAPASAIKTADLLRAAISRELAETTWPVVVLSDQNIPADNPRVVQVAPPAVQNVDIVRLAAGSEAHPQVMVRIRNQSLLKSAQLAVATKGQSVARSIDLPLQNGEQNYFIDLPALGETIEARLDVADDLPADNVAWVVDGRRWPRLEVKAGLPPELQTMVEVYRGRRAAGDNSPNVTISNALRDDEIGVILSDQTDAKPSSGGVGVQVGDHPVAAGVDWKRVLRDAVISEPPLGGWRPVVQAGSLVLVAVREKPVRQVWVGFASASFPSSKDFVIFWSNVFDWLGEGGDEFVSGPVQSIGEEWKLQTPAMAGFDLSPGVYRRSDGVLRAMNANDIWLNPPAQTDWATRLNGKSITKAAGFDLRPLLLIFALAMVLASATLWKSRGA